MPALDILLSCKRFDRGKARLAPVLNAEQRERICRWMFHHTLQVILGAMQPTWRLAIASDSDEVLAAARRIGALILEDAGNDASAAANAAKGALDGKSALLIISADLPLLTNADVLELVGSPHAVTLVPDQHGKGTNALLLSNETKRPFQVSFGPGSLERHKAEATRLGAVAHLARPEGIVFDLDEPSDLAVVSKRPALQRAGFPLPPLIGMTHNDVSD